VRFNVCGLVKARAVLLWHAPAQKPVLMSDELCAPTGL
jgi:hypothetical protein